MHQLRRTRLLVAVPAALLALSLVGCGDLLQDQAEKRAEDAAKSEGVDLDIDDGDVKVDTTDGGASVGELPNGFPTDEVPVVEGEILGGTYTKNPETWNVTIKVDEAGGDKTGAYDAAESQLTGAGLETTREKVDNGTSISGQYTSASYAVELAVTDSNGVTVTYLVSPK
ncbi:hypothetical protein [Nocardioides antri]|uniref:Lipoprotein n=1 Tax=Nocardioides antri TaxID=2607659 RepID=A0A5B1LYX8_9ACTN|nr:hypothetical protein [Nocardioides antri]KAA1425863.1 hypothetical protein F0U47_16065 [Nocardioides antri]